MIKEFIQDWLGIDKAHECISCGKYKELSNKMDDVDRHLLIARMDLEKAKRSIEYYNSEYDRRVETWKKQESRSDYLIDTLKDYKIIQQELRKEVSLLTANNELILRLMKKEGEMYEKNN